MRSRCALLLFLLASVAVFDAVSAAADAEDAADAGPQRLVTTSGHRSRPLPHRPVDFVFHFSCYYGEK